MLDKTLNILEELKSTLLVDSRVTELKKAEAEMLKDEAFIKESEQLKKIEYQYNCAIEQFGEDYFKAQELKKELVDQKIKVNSLNSVNEYNKAFAVVRDLFTEIDFMISQDLKITNKGCKNYHD